MTLALKQKLKIKPSAISLLTFFSIMTVGGHILSANAAPIYKVVDERTGQVTFTDSPQSYEQQADKRISQTGITTGNTIGNSSSFNAASTNRTTTSANGNDQASQLATAPKPTLQAAVNYQLTMVEPKAERAYQRPGQIITVNLQLSPALQAGDRISIYLDDKLISQGVTASIATIDLNPGEHTIQAIIENKAGQIINRLSRKVYVIQNTSILRQKQQLAQQLQAYQRLPWQQKLLLKLRQKDIVTNDK
ncbi:DUF4124 domain-containing protein [Psychrobacter sp. 1Y11]|uniref:DUF4124 domain-containing protein n=1 Tax=Psychrobacter sp. 1Y11 TaxID=3457446 RepID=UPI003FCF1BD7